MRSQRQRQLQPRRAFSKDELPNLLTTIKTLEELSQADNTKHPDLDPDLRLLAMKAFATTSIHTEMSDVDSDLSQLAEITASVPSRLLEVDLLVPSHLHKAVAAPALATDIGIDHHPEEPHRAETTRSLFKSSQTWSV